jgi:NADH:ubiquinone oxidoreductase subunit K
MKFRNMIDCLVSVEIMKFRNMIDCFVSVEFMKSRNMMQQLVSFKHEYYLVADIPTKALHHHGVVLVCVCIC